MARIKIKSSKNGRDQKLKLLEILCKKDIEICKIITTHYADCIFKQDTRQELTSHDFSPVLPPELKAKKSVIIPRVDVIYKKNTVDTGEEIVRQTSWIGGTEEIEDV